MITLKRDEWRKIELRLREEYAHKPSIMMIRYVMKRELGFTVRDNSQWVPGSGQYDGVVCLDFYDDVIETVFRLKYL